MSRKLIGFRKKTDSMKVENPATKAEKAVIHWVRQNVPVKKTKFLHSHVVEYFKGSKAVDFLLKDSPWSAGNQEEDDDAVPKSKDDRIVFHTREDVVLFMDEMLKHNFFHRANKVTVSTKKVEKSSTTDSSTPMLTRRRKAEAEKNSSISKAKDDEADKSSSTKRKIRLDMHLQQEFLDSDDAYVWIYNPMPWYYWIYGSLIVLGLIVVCMFPLWPSSMRVGVHYMSLAAASFMAAILALALLKYTVFALFYGLSGGRLSLWLLPNLTEDVGFLQSFWPLYDYTFTSTGQPKIKSKRSKRKCIEDKDSDEMNKDDQIKTGADDADRQSNGQAVDDEEFHIVN